VELPRSVHQSANRLRPVLGVVGANAGRNVVVRPHQHAVVRMGANAAANARLGGRRGPSGTRKPAAKRSFGLYRISGRTHWHRRE